MDKSRLETLSDGVFAIVITLLILDVRFPADFRLDTNADFRLDTNADFWRGFRLVLPNMGAYALSFGLISVFWNAHHTMFRFIQTIDERLVWMNLAYLAFVMFIPFPTSLLAKAPQLEAVVRLYALTLLATSLFHPIILFYMRKHWRQNGTYDHAGWSRSFSVSLVAPAFYAMAIVLTTINVTFSYVPLVVVPLFYVVRSWTGTFSTPTSREGKTNVVAE